MSKAMSMENADKAVRGTPTAAVLVKYATSSAATKAILFDALAARQLRTDARKAAYRAEHGTDEAA